MTGYIQFCQGGADKHQKKGAEKLPAWLNSQHLNKRQKKRIYFGKIY